MADLDVGKIVDAARDAVEKGVVACGAMFGVDLREHVARSTPKAPIASGEPYRIDDVIDAETGATVIVVTDGTSSVDCPTSEDAHALLAALAQRGLPVLR
jgi:hypothetical protein